MTLRVTIEVWKRIAMHFAEKKKLEKELLYRWNESPKIQRQEDRVVLCLYILNSRHLILH
jgi:hypothetical protein